MPKIQFIDCVDFTYETKVPIFENYTDGIWKIALEEVCSKH